MAGKSVKSPKLFPPSMAGACLRYSVMELLRFGRMIDPESLERMRLGTAFHKQFQAQLQERYADVAIEKRMVDADRGISGRIDAVIEEENGPIAVEYKTVGLERFAQMQEQGPVLTHILQLMVYLAMGSFDRGYLIVEARESHERLSWIVTPDPLWIHWIYRRIEKAQAYQTTRKLPEREISRECLRCDRWQRCFKSEMERAEAVVAHPIWNPEPAQPEHETEWTIQVV